MKDSYGGISKELFDEFYEHVSIRADELEEKYHRYVKIEGCKFVTKEHKNPDQYEREKEHPKIQITMKVGGLGYHYVGYKKNTSSNRFQPNFNGGWVGSRHDYDPMTSLESYLKKNTEEERAKKFIKSSVRKLDRDALIAVAKYVEEELDE